MRTTSENNLEIRVLGSLEILRDGRAVALPASKKTRALCGYLIVTARPQLRERLCELLWEGPDDPRAALRWSLTKIRPLLDGPKVTRLVADRERVAFAPEEALIDLDAVRTFVGAAPANAPTEGLRAAAECFRGEFLEGLDLADCYRYNQWCLGEREGVRALRVAILSTLVIRLREEPEVALRYARAHVAVDPLSEGAHIAVLRLLSALGRTKEALKQYESCRRILEQELHMRPSEELERARMALHQTIPAPSPAHEATPLTAVPASPPAPSSPLPRLVGRQKEHAIVEQLLAATLAGRPHPVLAVMGDPGIGKSRLLEEVKALGRASGGQVLGGRAFEAEMVRPYGAWIDALRSVPLGALDPPLRADLSPLLPELGDAQAVGGDRNRLFDAVVRLLVGLASSAPVTLVLDDIQWFDEASAALLHYASRALEGARVLLACGARPGELADNPAARRLLRALAREDRLREIPLAALDAEETAILARSIDPEIDVHRVFAESEGNPLFVLEVARALLQGDAPLSETLDGLIGDRLSRLDERARDLLPWTAALGHAFGLELLASTTGVKPAELVAAVDELERRGVLRATTRPDGQPGYDFAHDLIRRAAYRQLSEPRRRLIHGQIAGALAKLLEADGTLASDLAHHAALGFDEGLAVRAAVAAAERCLRVYAHDEARELVARGKTHLRNLAPDERIRQHIALLKIELFASSAGFAMSGGRSQLLEQDPALEAEISRLILDAQSRGLHAEASGGLFLLSALHHDVGDFHRTQEETLRAAEAGRAADPRTAAYQLANSARCLAQIEGDMTQAHLLIEEAKALALRNQLDFAELYWGLGLVACWDGAYDEAIAHLERALLLAQGTDDHWRACASLTWLIMIDLERGHPADALARTARLIEVAARLGEGSEVPFARALDALAHWMKGGPSASERLELAIAELRAVDSKAHLAYVLTLVAEGDLRAGRSELARDRAAEALASAELVGRRSQQALACALLAEIALESGDRAAAIAKLQPALALAADRTALPARSHRAIAKVAQALGLSIPTPTSTPAHTT